MGFYYTPMETTDSSMVYINKAVTVLATAVDESTAEAFETGLVKLVTPDNADSYPVFNTDEVPWVSIEPLGDYQILLKRSSEAVNSGTGGFGFSVYISSVFVEPSDGIYKCNFLIHAS